MNRRKLVVLESPYGGDVERNLRYARACIKHSILMNEAPIASHLLYTQPGILDDSLPEERALGIACGHAWIAVAEMLVVYTDLGITEGMRQGIELARKLEIDKIAYRSLGPEFMKSLVV